MRVDGRHRGGDQRDSPEPSHRRPVRGAIPVREDEPPGQMIDEVDAQRPQRRLDQPDGQGPLAEGGLAGREQHRIARRPDREMRDVAPLDILVRPTRADGPCQLPVDVGVGEDVQPERLTPPDVPLDGIGRRHPQGQGDLEHQRPARPAGPAHAPSPRRRPERTRIPEGSARPCIVPGLTTRATGGRPLRGWEKGGPDAHTTDENPRGRWPQPSCAAMVCQRPMSVNHNPELA